MVSRPLDAISKLIFNSISSKECANRPSFKRFLLIPSTKYQQEHCILMPCWTFLLRLGIGFLVGPAHSRMGKRPAFFVFGHRHSRSGAEKKGRRLVCRIVIPPRPLMFLFICPDSHHHSEAGILFVRLASACSGGLLQDTNIRVTTHNELLKKCDVYREIAESQLSKEELENA